MEKRAVLIVFDGENPADLEWYSRSKWELHKSINHNKLVKIKNGNTIELDKVKYIFFNLKSRNLQRFMQKNHYINQVFITQQANRIENYVHWLTLVDRMDQIQVLESLNVLDLFAEYQKESNKIGIFVLDESQTKVLYNEVFEYEFNDKIHFRTENEAKSYLKQRIQRRIEQDQREIQLIQKRLKRDNSLLSKLT